MIAFFVIFFSSILFFLKLKIPQVFADPRGEHYDFNFDFWNIKTFPALYPTQDNIWKWKIIKDCSILLLLICIVIEIVLTLIYFLKKAKPTR